MKKILLFLAAASLASATAITLGSLELLGDSDLIASPMGTTYTIGGFGSVGGLCTITQPAATIGACPTSGSPTPDVLTFTLSTASTVNILLQDRASVGDVYQVVLNTGSTGTSAIDVYTSSSVSLGGTTSQGCWDGTAGLADNSCLNITTGTLAAGSYSITVWDILLSYVGQTDPFGGGTIPHLAEFGRGSYSPASFNLELNATPVTVPEPATLALLGLGGIALGLFRRRIAK
jgi:hypothetical protein